MRPGPIVVERELLASKAFHDLDGKAAKVLMWFLTKRRMAELKTSKRQEWVIANNGEIVFTYKEAEERHGLKPQAFSQAIDELQENGFIDIECLGTGIGRAPTLYAISKRWKKYGTPEFKVMKRQKRSSHRFASGEDHPIHRKPSISQL